MFIAHDSERAAETFVQRIFREAERLAVFPRSGRVVPEAQQDDLREIMVASYRVLYRLRDDLVEIVRVIHGARLLGSDDLPRDLDNGA